MEAHKEKIHSLEKDIYERNLITASSDGIIRIFTNTNNQNENIELELKQELGESKGPCVKALFVDNSDYIVSAYFSGIFVLWRLENGLYTKVFEKKVVDGNCNDIAVVNAETLSVYLACSDGNIKILSICDDKIVNEEEILAHRFGVSSIAAGSGYVVSGGIDQSVCIWKNKEEVKRFKMHDSFVRVVKIAPENVFGLFCFASGGEDGKVVVYEKIDDDFKTQELVFDEPVHSLSWSKSGFTLSVGYGQCKYKCYVPSEEGQFSEVQLIQKD